MKALFITKEFSMHERALYAAHPINTYGTPLAADYLRYLTESFPQASEVIDPASDAVKREVERIKQEHSRDPTSGEFNEKLYNEVGAKQVMKYFESLAGTASAGAGLMLPMSANDVFPASFKIPAGIAKELRTILRVGPVWVVKCVELAGEVFFQKHLLVGFRLKDPSKHVTGLLTEKPEEVCEFVTEEGHVFSQLSVQETGERIYTQLPDGSWDRKNLKSYFIE